MASPFHHRRRAPRRRGSSGGTFARGKSWSIADITALMISVFALTLIWLNRDAFLPESAAVRPGFAMSTVPETGRHDGGSTPDLPRISFGLCHTGGGSNCVVDGDTFWLNGEKIRIADIDTPETHPARCAREAELGEQATLRLQAYLSAGPISLAPAASGDNYDRYGRRLAVVERGGASIGMMLVSEGLARPYSGGPRAGWC